MQEATCPHCGKSMFIDPTYHYRQVSVGGVTTCGWYCSPHPFAARIQRYEELRRDAAARKLRPYSDESVEAGIERCIKLVDRRLKQGLTRRQHILAISRAVAGFRQKSNNEEDDEIRGEIHWHVLKHYDLHQEEVL